mmetsp:Transcript_143608/g.459409  ORF Transcript_143608/g.459409 Transcript_143608/m.459409 type:complete len:225 (+) Transcript_143608:1126-1800(+)
MHGREPLVRQRDGRRGPHARRLLQAGSDEAFRLRRDAAPKFRLHLDVGGPDSLEDLVHRLPAEGMATGEHDIADHTQAPDVRLLVVPAHQHLRRDVVRSARLRLRKLPGLEALADAEIDESQRCLSDIFPRSQQPILGLQIAVHDEVLMQVVDGKQHLLHALGTDLLAEVARLADPFEELPTLAQLQTDVDAARILEALDEPDDVGVVEDAHDLDLLLQPLGLV